MSVKIGFSTNVFDNPPDIVASVRQIAEDFEYVELELGDAAERTVYEASPEQYAVIVQELRALIETKGLHLSLHAPYIGHTANLSALDEQRRLRSIERLKTSILFARDIGARMVTCHPGLRLKQTNEVLLPRLMQSLSEVMPFAAQYGVQLCVENMGNERPNYIVLTPDEQIEMCRGTGAGITLDLIHLASLEGLDDGFYSSLERMAPYLRNMHIADMVVPSHVHIPIGEGDLPLERCLRFLADHGYHGPAIVEEFGGPFETDMFYRNARAFRHYFETSAQTA